MSMKNEKMKNEKINFIWDQEGHKVGDRRDLLHDDCFMFAKKIFC